MPHVEIPKRSFVVAAHAIGSKLANSYRRELAPILEPLAQDHGADLIGLGVERFVFAVPGNSSKVASIDYERKTPEQVMMLYLMHNIYNALWPHNFPQVYAMSKTLSDFTCSIKERVDRKDLPRHAEIIYPFDIVKSESHRWHLPLPIDHYPNNFVFGEDGGEYYVDGFEIDWLTKALPRDQFDFFMSSRGESDAFKAKILSRIGRFNWAQVELSRKLLGKRF